MLQLVVDVHLYSVQIGVNAADFLTEYFLDTLLHQATFISNLAVHEVIEGGYPISAAKST